jgi:hypothetical protein
MSSSTQIVPFWHRLRAISLYPLRNGALMALGAFTGASTLLYILPMGLVGLLCRLVLTAAVYAYAVVILRATANGHFDSPEVSLGGESSGWWQIALQVVFMIAMALGFAFFGEVGGTIFAILLALGMPGATLSLAIDDNFWHALNPGTWIAIANRLGWPYLAVAALCGVIIISQGNAQALLEYLLPDFLAIIASYFISTYAVFMTFHLMGYLIYQYHEDLGYEIDTPLARRDANADPDQDVLDEAAALVVDGDAAGAEKLIGARLHARGGTAAVHAQYRKLLRLRGDEDALLAHGGKYLAVLMEQGQDKLALELVRDCLALDPDFVVSRSEDVATLSRRAVELAQPRVAVTLLEGFVQRHFSHPDAAGHALAAAKLRVETFGEDAHARALLKAMRQHTGNHPGIDGYLAFLDKLAAPAVRA